MSFGKAIIHWYDKHKRAMPWRNTRNPYRIWVSEIILQQTRVEQGLDYYKRFIKKYPDVKKLAAAKEGEVLKLWQGLGYYTRARNLHHTAKEIVKRHKGRFPQTWDEMLSLKGIGDYTAAAVLSFAFNKKYPVVDGNVYRLLSRYLGIKTPLNTAKAKKEFYEVAMELMDEVTAKDYSTFNQAIMEFGSRMCKPANPDCLNCTLQSSCYANANSKVKQLPVKKKKEKPRERYFHYFVIKQGDKILLRKRTENDIWKNLYDFPMIERRVNQFPFIKNEFDKYFKFKGQINTESVYVCEMKHQLTHQTIHVTFHEHHILSPFSIKSKDVIAVSPKNLKKYALPRPIEKYLARDS
jgi:A/G-specific adenine glycosylase